MLTNRTLNLSRRFVVALLAVALSSQLAQGQLLRCSKMDMSAKAGAMQSMQPSAHQGHDVMIAIASSSNHDAQNQVPVSSSCILSGVCLVAPAVPAASQPAFGDDVDSSVIASGTTSPAELALRPESPPPRL
jgi:hypothetical protein